MKNSVYWKGPRLWIEGLLLLCLRWAQLKTGFDPDTGLSRPSMPGTVLLAAIVFLAAAECVVSLRGVPGGKRTFLNCFEPPERRELPLLVAGSLLICAGGVLLPGWSTLAILSAVMAAATAAGFILLARMLRNGGQPKTLFLLPSMFLSVLLVLTVYLPEANNPVLARYALPVLAAALIACAFYQLTGLTCREGSLRWFVFFGNLSVPLSLAAMADSAGNLGRTLLWCGCALTLTVFLLLRRADPLPEPEPEEDDSGKN